MELKLETALGAMKIIRDNEIVEGIGSFGIADSDMRLTLGNGVWIGQNRGRVVKCLSSLVWGTLDTMGAPRFEVPAEYIAAMIMMFVKPININTACSWMDNIHSADGIMNEETEKPLPIKAREIFALVITMYNDKRGHEIKDAFEDKIAKQIENLEEKA